MNDYFQDPQQPGFDYQQPAWGGMQPTNQQVQGQGGRLSPELINAMLQLQMNKGKQSDINRQMQMAQALRENTAGPAKATSPGGGRVGAPNWAGTLANVYGQYKAGQMDRQAQADSAALDEKRMIAAKKIYKNTTGQDYVDME
jgi:hypothetical protein